MAKQVTYMVYRYFNNHILSFILAPILVTIALNFLKSNPKQIINKLASLQYSPLQMFIFSFLLIFITTFYFMTKPRSIYLLDYSCFKPPSHLRFSHSTFTEHSKINFKDNAESLDFQIRLIERSGLGDETCLPPAIHCIPPNPTMENSRAEAEMVIFSSIDSLLEKTKLHPTDIDVLVVNCSLFTTTPSLSAMVINKYKMRSNIRSYNLSGMGCSAGLLSVDLARQILLVHPNLNALIISTEIITPNYYLGQDRARLVANCLFRMGGAAVLLTNNWHAKKQAKYKLQHLIRTHTGADDKSYKCIYQEEDSQNELGISLSKNLTTIAGEALKSNITTIGPLVLPASEQLHFLFSLICRKILKMKRKAYIPDFKTAFEHFCIHAGGRAVIDELQKSLKLTAEDVEASRMTLYRFGNTSSSSIWYELAYMEGKGRMKKGDRVWQVALGGGFKCNSAIWICNRPIQTPIDGPWADSIHEYPAHIPEVTH